MRDGLDDMLDGSGEPGLPELRATLRELVGGFDSAARAVAQRLKRHVYRLRIEANDHLYSLVLKRMQPAVAERNRLVAERWLPAIGLSEAGPRLLGDAVARDGGYAWQVYDDLGDSTLAANATNRRAVEAAVDVIAQVHSRSAGHPILEHCRLHTDDLGMAFYAANVRAAIRGLEALQPPRTSLTSERMAVRDRLLAQLYQCLDEEHDRARALAELGGPEVLLHGDLWTTNVIVCPTEEGLHVRLIDWDHAGVGPLSYDLSTLLSRFPPRDRHWILQRYCSSIGWDLPSAADLNRLFATADWARWAICVAGRALDVVEGRHLEWAFDALASIEQWCALITPILPEAEY